MSGDVGVAHCVAEDCLVRTGIGVVDICVVVARAAAADNACGRNGLESKCLFWQWQHQHGRREVAFAFRFSSKPNSRCGFDYVRRFVNVQPSVTMRV